MAQVQDFLPAARQGDPEAFASLTEPHRKELLAHCYRMLGSLQEAEDMVQETFLRAWQKLDTFEARASFRAWLYKIATNQCLDVLRQGKRRALPVDVVPSSRPDDQFAPPSDEFAWLEPFPDAWLDDLPASPEAKFLRLESVTLAFMAAIQFLTPHQRASLILKDVLGLTTREIAELLEVSETAANSLIFRARQVMQQRYHRVEVEHHLSSRNEAPQVQRLLESYVQAWENANVDKIVSLLREDAVLAMPPSPSWVQGAQGIGRALALNLLDKPGTWKLRPVRSNGQPSFAFHKLAENGEWTPFGIQVLAIVEEKIVSITHFFYPGLVSRFE